jgi:hypothetical protein
MILSFPGAALRGDWNAAIAIRFGPDFGRILNDFEQPAMFPFIRWFVGIQTDYVGIEFL